MVQMAAPVAPGWDQIVFYIAYFPFKFQFGLENLFSGLWAHLSYYIVISFPGFVPEFCCNVFPIQFYFRILGFNNGGSIFYCDLNKKSM